MSELCGLHKVLRTCTGCIVFCLATSSLIAGDARINQVQVIGTHNSYHVAPAESLLMLIAERSEAIAQSMEYTHRPLSEQLSFLGIRHIELDVFPDLAGGLYSDPVGNKVAAARGLPTGPSLDPDGLLHKPGLKVFHTQDFDFRTTVLTVMGALEEVRNWSKSNPRHFPLLVMFELKEGSIGPDSEQTVPFGKQELEALETEILSVFSQDEILIPDDVRGDYATLPEALAQRGWPPVDAVRGKIFFAMLNDGRVRDTYLQGHPALKGRLLFVTVPESHPAAAWMRIDDPLRNFEEIQRLVRAGFLVRTRADVGTFEARQRDITRRDKAFASGAQFISTDFPEPNPIFSDYRVRFDGDIVVRTNPLNGCAKLKGKDLER